MAKYKTNQRAELVEYLRSRSGQHVTANEIMDYFRRLNIQIGLTTIYRQLNNLVETGLVKKFYIDDKTGSCFEYTADECQDLKHKHFHLKCESCGRLIHFECEEVNALQKHIKAEHGFLLDPDRTVFYGLCQSCLGKQ